LIKINTCIDFYLDHAIYKTIIEKNNMATIQITSPATQSIIRGTFTLRLKLSHVTEKHQLAIYLNGNKYLITKPSSKISLKNLPVVEGERTILTAALIEKKNFVSYESINIKYYPESSVNNQNGWVSETDNATENVNLETQEDEGIKLDKESKSNDKTRFFDDNFSSDILIKNWKDEEYSPDNLLDNDLKGWGSPDSDQESNAETFTPNSSALFTDKSCNIPMGISYVIINSAKAPIELTLPHFPDSLQNDNIVAVRAKIYIINSSSQQVTIMSHQKAKFTLSENGEMKLVLLGNTWYSHGLNKIK
jgi:hypothetical protein